MGWHAHACSAPSRGSLCFRDYGVSEPQASVLESPDSQHLCASSCWIVPSSPKKVCLWCLGM